MINQIFSYLNRKDLSSLFFIVILVIFGNLLEILSIGTIPLLLKLAVSPLGFIDKSPIVVQNQLNKLDYDQSHLIIIFSLILFFIFILKNLYLFTVHYYQQKFFKDLRIKNSDKLLNFYFSQPYSFFLNNNPALMLRSLSSDLDLANVYIEALLNLTKEILIIFFIFSILLFVNTSVSLSVMIGIFFFSYLIFFTFKKKLSNLSKINFKERGKQIKIVNQIFGNIQDIKISLKEKFFFNKFKKNIVLLKHSDFFHQLFSKVPRLIFETLAVLAIVSVIIFYMYNDRSIQDLLPLLALFGMCALRLIPSFNQILLGFSVLKKSRVSFESIVKEFNEIKNNSYQIKLSDNLKNKNLISNNIIIKNVSYKYQNTDKFVLKDINIEIKKNSSIGIIGKTGCGKSTLIKIILGLLEPTSGKILADGKDIKNDLNTWYKNLSYVPQSVYLNDDSIKTNIAIGENENEISEEKILRTIELAGLKNFISSLPNKLNTKVGSQGVRLSGGQIQRIGIARALYTEPNIFILDEATSSLDRKTEDEVINDFFKLKKNNFTIIVSHRLSSLKFCNEVFFIKDGKIKDRGKIDDLILRNQDISK